MNARATTDTAAPAWMAWLLYSTAYLRPSFTLGFLWFSARCAHGAPASLLWVGTIGLTVALDVVSGHEQRPPAKAGRVFDLHLYLLFGVQLFIFAAFVATLRRPELTVVDAAVAAVLVGVNSGYASLILAHELIHRRQRHLQLMGRALLGTCLYEHWFTEHLRAHHIGYGRPEDAGTARAGETYWQFCRRSIPDQLVNAWRLEATRAGCRGWRDPRWLRSRVVQGLLAEAALLAAVAAVAGPWAVAIAVGQAAIAVLLLEAVDYFTHFGLLRDARNESASWDSGSLLTLYSLLGLARHADHHRHPGRPFYELLPDPRSHTLPHGYPLMVLLAMFANRRFQRLLAADARRRDQHATSAAGVFGAASAAPGSQ